METMNQEGRIHILWVITFALIFLGLQILGLNMPTQAQYWILMVGILIGGIPHGAIDHLIYEEESRLEGKSFNLYYFYFQYLTAMGVYALIWWFSPLFSLSLFIMMTAWHFGETDLFFETYPNKIIRSLFYMLYGLWVIAVLLASHKPEIESLFNSLGLTQLNPSLKGILFFQYNGNGLLFMEGLLLWLLSGLFFKNWSSTLLLQIAFVFILSFLPLALAFTLYFTAWHSLRSLKEISHFIKKGVSRIKFVQLLLPNTLLSLVFLGGLYYFWVKAFPLGSFILLVFVLLSLLTLPHFVIMHFLFDKSSKDQPLSR